MKTYVVASLFGAAAFALIVLGTPARSAPAADLAWSVAWPADGARMAQRAGHPWLLRAMSTPAGAATLTSLPCPGPATARSL
jgi:hypothetical protein